MMSRAVSGALCRRLVSRHVVTRPISDASLSLRFDSSYSAAKKAAKERRREQYEHHQARLERLKTRREGRPRGVKKEAFQSWFIPRLIYQQKMDRKARQLGLDWNIRVATIVERLPIITADTPQWEKDYLDLKAYLDQFGKVYPKELGMADPELDDNTAVPTDEELLEMLPEGFIPAPRETEADKSGDVRTLNRRLKTRVYLTVQKKENEKWGFPAATLEGDETLLEGANRALVEAVGSDMDLYCPSNCPVAVDMQVPPEEERVNGMFGTKTFFMRIQHDEGDVSESDMTVGDFAWLDRSEMVERVLKERGEGPSKFYHYLL